MKKCQKYFSKMYTSLTMSPFSYIADKKLIQAIND